MNKETARVMGILEAALQDIVLEHLYVETAYVKILNMQRLVYMTRGDTENILRVTEIVLRENKPGMGLLKG